MKRVLALCGVVLILSGCGFRSSELSMAAVSGVPETDSHQDDETISFPAAGGSWLSSRGCDFAFDGYDLTLFWPDGNTYVFPNAAQSEIEKQQHTAVYVSEKVSGVALFDADSMEMRIYTGSERGKSWTEAVLDMQDPTPEGAEYRDFWLDICPYDIWMGYTSESDGWLMLTTYYGMSSGKQFLYKTSDGGVSWERRYESEWRRYAVGAGFSEKYGFLSLVRTEEIPVVYRTSDGGVTWEEFDLLSLLPKEYHDYIYEACAPVFEGEYGEWTLLCRNTPEDGAFYPLPEDHRGTDGGRDGGVDALLVLVTEDGGETWSIQP